MTPTQAHDEACAIVSSLLDDLTASRRLAIAADDRAEIARATALGYGPATVDPDACHGSDTSIAESRLLAYAAWSIKADRARTSIVRARRPLLTLARAACRPRERRVLESLTFAPTPVSIDDVSKDLHIAKTEVRRLESSGLRRMESCLARVLVQCQPRRPRRLQEPGGRGGWRERPLVQ